VNVNESAAGQTDGALLGGCMVRVLLSPFIRKQLFHEQLEVFELYD
jgi:hypothetical protein